MRVLDLDAVRAFVMIADLNSFTRAANAMNLTQSAISLKLKRLEASLGKKLLERTPRAVRLSQDGLAFLAAARDLLHANDRALGTLSTARRRLVLGLSEHIAGADLPALLARLNTHDPDLAVEMQLGCSRTLVVQYEERRFDAVMIRRVAIDSAVDAADDPGRADAQSLFAEPLVWLAASHWLPRSDEPLPIAVLCEPCEVRAMAIRILDAAGIRWREVFVSGSLTAVCAAVAAGFAVSPLARRVAPRTLVDVGARLGLPPLPVSYVTLYSRVQDAHSLETLRVIASQLTPSQ
jgi:DNA-binding transcriptional LysR family regulator